MTTDADVHGHIVLHGHVVLHALLRHKSRPCMHAGLRARLVGIETLKAHVQAAIIASFVQLTPARTIQLLKRVYRLLLLVALQPCGHNSQPGS